MKIGIVGVGLLGGSLAAALKNHFGDQVYIKAFSSKSTLEKAKQTGIYSEYYTYDQLQDNCTDLDFLFLCTPISIIIDLIETLGQVPVFKSKTIITDIGSTKETVMNAAEKAFGGRSDVYFVGGHPMTGNEFHGIDAADPLLYENAIYVITPTKETPDELLEKYIIFAKAIRSIPLVIEAEMHDQVVAGISHLPQMLATGLVDLISKKEHSALSKTLCAGGFRDMTRIASSQYTMWRDIVETNKDNIKTLIGEYIKELETIKDAMDSGELANIFDNARKTRDDIPFKGKGLLVPHFEILVRVHDEPGMLLSISTILAEQNINIRDISVLNSREREGGHFLLGFDTNETRQAAIDHLSAKDFSVKIID